MEVFNIPIAFFVDVNNGILIVHLVNMVLVAHESHNMVHRDAVNAELTHSCGALIFT